MVRRMKTKKGKTKCYNERWSNGEVTITERKKQPLDEKRAVKRENE